MSKISLRKTKHKNKNLIKELCGDDFNYEVPSERKIAKYDDSPIKEEETSYSQSFSNRKTSSSFYTPSILPFSPSKKCSKKKPFQEKIRHIKTPSTPEISTMSFISCRKNKQSLEEKRTNFFLKRNIFSSKSKPNKTKIKKKVSFKINFVETINVKSWKKYNLISFKDKDDCNKLQCTCIII